MRKPSTWVADVTHAGDHCVALVNHNGLVLTRLPQRYATLGEAQGEADRRNEKVKRGAK